MWYPTVSNRYPTAFRSHHAQTLNHKTPPTKLTFHGLQSISQYPAVFLRDEPAGHPCLWCCFCCHFPVFGDFQWRPFMYTGPAPGNASEIVYKGICQEMVDYLAARLNFTWVSVIISHRQKGRRCKDAVEFPKHLNPEAEIFHLNLLPATQQNNDFSKHRNPAEKLPSELFCLTSATISDAHT